ncbi:GNAT family N-acetyltransferase [Nocardioides sp. SYSU D00065]|uniref:GNAT family N-acetyltransferase n=1 Tax=Nocardioides sp. SYSU D00065 TaxID=2817378 RepID=UPI001B3395C9|nr:GNAT family protein [Nocardioides sp. SYSU D00065]
MEHRDSPTTAVLPLTLDHARALLAGPDTFRDTFGLSVAEGYLAFPEALGHIVEALESGMAPQWFSHLIVDEQRGAVVGLGGFTGPPADDTVEVGYSVAPEARGQGHATRAVQAWLRFAQRHGVGSMTATTMPEENASTAVLHRCGFEKVGEVADPNDGPTWRWRLDLHAEGVSSAT